MRPLYSVLFAALFACAPSEAPLPEAHWSPGVQDDPVTAVSGSPAHQRSEHLTLWHGIATEQLSLQSDRLLGDSRDAILVTVPAHLEQSFAPSATPRFLQTAVRRTGSRPVQGVVAEAFWRESDGEIQSLKRVRLDDRSTSVSEAWTDLHVALPTTAGDLVLFTRDSVGSSRSSDTEVAWQAPVVHPSRNAAASAGQAPLPDILLITVDTFRSDALANAPELSAVLADGLSWPKAISPSNWTLPAYGSLFSGLDADHHQAGRGPFTTHATGKPEDRQLSAIDPDVPLLAEIFREAGYATAMVHQNPMLETWTGLARGFERYARAGDQTQHVLELGDTWWKAHDQRPRFLVLHFMAPHLPYTHGPTPNPLQDLEVANFFGADHSPKARAEFFDLSEDKREVVRARYRAGVRHLDQQLGPWVQLQLQQQASLIVAFHSDHGEELWDNGSFEHGHSFDRSVIEVPIALVTNRVDRFRQLKPTQIDEAAPAHALGGTLCDLVGLSHSFPTLLLDNGQPNSFKQASSLMPLYRSQHTGRVIGPEVDRFIPFAHEVGSGGRGAPISEAKLRMLAELGYLAQQHQR